MLQVSLPIPNNFYVACSGGVDSMAVLSFLLKRRPKVAYMNHGTEHGQIAMGFVKSFCKTHNLHLEIGNISRPKNTDESKEEYWRNQRYDFLHSLPLPVFSAHHLDDAVEQWLFSSLCGKPGVMPISNRNVFRPFMKTKKSEMVSWCTRKGIPWVEDTSNADVHYARNRIRHNIMPEVLAINPGIHKVVCKIVDRQYKTS